jgi:hypothetical protein
VKLTISVRLANKLDCQWGLFCSNCEQRLELKEGVIFERYHLRLCRKCVHVVFEALTKALEKAK